MRFILDPNARSPLYRQLQDQVRYAVSVGDLAPGDVLPSIRDLEARLGVNRNTVRQAYLELEAEGLIVLRQGREARVAERRRPRKRSGAPGHPALAEELATTLLQRAEAEGLDGVQFAEYFARAAREHDAAHPRCAFLECSRRQADFFARHTERHLGRRVLGIDLHDIRGGAGRLPASVHVVLTPHWHLGEARALLRDHPVEVIAVLVHLSEECVRRLKALEGLSIGLVVRDAESAAGYRRLLSTHTRARRIEVALADDVPALTAMAAKVQAIVYTSPCEETVRFVAPARLKVEEFVFEPAPEELITIRNTVFPALTRAHAPV